MSSTKVNSTVMREKATRLREISKTIKSFTEEMTGEMNCLRSAWEGEVAETTVRKFQGLTDDFEERFNTINNYARFLENAAEEWDRVNEEDR